MPATRRIQLVMAPTGGWQRDFFEGFASRVAERSDWQLHVAMQASDRPAELPPGRIDALISAPSPSHCASAYGRRLAPRPGRPPCHGISVYSEPDGLLPHAIIPDYAALARLAIDHLLSANHRQLVYLHVAAHDWTQQLGHELDAICAADGIQLERLLCHGPGSSWRGQVRRQLRQRFARQQQPIGIIAEALVAAHCANACHGLGLGIPEQVAILSLDDNQFYNAMSRTPLSAVHLPGLSAGHACAELLDELFSGTRLSPLRRTLAPLSVITRQSTAISAIDDAKVAWALAIINRQISNGEAPPSVADLAEQVGVSRRTLEQRFRQHLGRSPGAEIRRTRMVRAQDLLRQSDARIADIGRECGFADPGQFSRDFRRVTGRTPREWREAAP